MALGKGLNSLIPQGKPRKVFRRQTSGGSDKTGQVWHVPISEIVPNSEQPRKHFSHQELEDLVASIKTHGILQPITVTEKDDGGYELIAGERRLRASQIAELATVPAMVRSATQQEKLELALIENLQREDLNPIEEGFAYKRLIEEFGMSQQQVAEQVGKQRPTVANMMRLLGLPEQIQKAIIDGKLSKGKAKAILSLKSEKEQLNMFSSMMGDNITVRDVESRVASKGQASRKGSVRRDPNLLAQEKLLEESLGTKVQITKRGERGRIVIDYYSNDELRRLITELS